MPEFHTTVESLFMSTWGKKERRLITILDEDCCWSNRICTDSVCLIRHYNHSYEILEIFFFRQYFL